MIFCLIIKKIIDNFRCEIVFNIKHLNSKVLLIQDWLEDLHEMIIFCTKLIEDIFSINPWFCCCNNDCVTPYHGAIFKLLIETQIQNELSFHMYHVPLTRALTLPLAFLKSELTWSWKFSLLTILTLNLFHVLHFFTKDLLRASLDHPFS